MAVDALAPSIARSSAAMVLIMWDKWATVMHGEGFQLPVYLSIENDLFFSFSQMNSAHQELTHLSPV